MSKEAMKMALEALEWSLSGQPIGILELEAITALRAALDEPQTTHWEGCEAVHPECKKPEPVLVSPTTFIQTVLYKEDTIGRPTIWAQWPNEEKNI